jgi:phosphatidylglycerol:prolipoprotein diacylglycerol transferase
MEIHAYPAFLCVGLTFGVVAGTAVGEAHGVSPVPLYAALLLLIVPALVGSRLLYVLTHWRFYRQQPSLVWSRQTGGAALYGGLLLALACSWPVLRLLGIPFGAFWDAATITILVGMVFTKIGCLLNGCCAGRATSGWFALRLPNASGVWCRRVPTQLLECALAAGLLWGCLSWTARPFDGALFLSTLAIYGAARLPLGATRESLDRLAGVNVHNLISVMLVLASVASLAIIWWLRLRHSA